MLSHMILKTVWPNSELDSGTVNVIAQTLTANIIIVGSSGGVSQGVKHGQAGIP